jgi:phosphoribosylformylglycinamidine synthase
MSMIRALVLRSAGTNCDEETAAALRLGGAEPELLHVGALLRGERRLGDFDLLAFPGGFSYGDDLGAGTVLACRLRTVLSRDLEEFVGSGRLVIGICNGFQVLVRLGLLPGWPGEKAASLIENTSGKFEDRWVSLRVEGERCPFLLPGPVPGPQDLPSRGPGARGARGSVIRLPVAHREGRFVVRDPAALERLEAGGQVALRYVAGPDDPTLTTDYPANPNGSVGGIAGITNPEGNVLGLMPHPERHVHRYQEPTWTRRRDRVGFAPEHPGDGFPFFANAVRYLAARKGVASGGSRAC